MSENYKKFKAHAQNFSFVLVPNLSEPPYPVEQTTVSGSWIMTARNHYVKNNMLYAELQAINCSWHRDIIIFKPTDVLTNIDGTFFVEPHNALEDDMQSVSTTSEDSAPPLIKTSEDPAPRIITMQEPSSPVSFRGGYSYHRPF